MGSLSYFLIIVIPAFIIFGILVWYACTRNSIKRAELKVEEAESGIDVALTKRYDMLTKALDTARAYAAHEKELLVSVTTLRSGASMDEKSAQNRRLDDLSNRISAVAEAYPELRSDSVFASLQAQIADAEEHLQAARRLYNSNVTNFNEKLVTFPSKLVANRMCLEKKPFFMADAASRADVKIEI